MIVRDGAATPAKREPFEEKPTSKLDRDEVLALLAQGSRRAKRPTDLDALIEVVKDAPVSIQPVIASGAVRFANTVRKTPVSGVNVVASVIGPPGVIADPPAPITEPPAPIAEHAVLDAAVPETALAEAPVAGAAVDAAVLESPEIPASMVDTPGAPDGVALPVVGSRPDRTRDLAIGIAIGISALVGIWIAISL